MEESSKAYFPTEWEDDQRMTVLFSAFRERQVNPQSWDKKMKFWSDLILEDCKNSNVATVSAVSLPQRFTRKGKMPLCIPDVIHNMHSKGKLQKLSDFQNQAPQGWISWGVQIGVNYLVKKPLQSLVSMVWRPSTFKMEEIYVVQDIVKLKASEILQKHKELLVQGQTCSIIPYQTLCESCQDICGDELTFQLSLHQLTLDKKIAVLEELSHGKLIKFAEDHHKDVKPVSEAEITIMKLKQCETKLTVEIEKLSEEMERCRSDAKLYLKQGLKNAAKCALQRKRALLNRQEKKKNSLLSINTLLENIHEAESANMVIGAYKAGTATFRDLTERYGINTDNIDKVMDDVNEVLDTQSDINEAMSQPVGDTSMDISMSELESELEALLNNTTSLESSQNPTANPDQKTSFDSLTDSLQGLDISGDKGLEFPEVPKFDPGTPPKVATARSPNKPIQSPLYG